MQTTLKNYWETTQPYAELVALKVKKRDLQDMSCLCKLQTGEVR